MTDDEAETIIRTVAAAYPATAFTEDMATLYRAMLRNKDFEHVWSNLDAHVRDSHWFPTPNELIVGTARPVALPRPGSGCDGSGWRNAEPCPRCNPYLRDLWNDAELWDRYLSGTPLHLLHPDVKLVRSGGRDRMEGEQAMPSPCKVDTIHDPHDAPADIVTGIGAARRGYEQECYENGREPNWAYFDAMFASPLRRALGRLGE